MLYVRQPITELNSGIAARETANHLGDLINAVRGICACTDDQNDQNVVIDNAKDVLDEAEQMMDCCKVLLSDPVSDVVQYGVCGGQYGFVGNIMGFVENNMGLWGTIWGLWGTLWGLWGTMWGLWGTI